MPFWKRESRESRESTENTLNALRRENKELKKRLRKLTKERAKISDMSPGSARESVERLRILTVSRENLEVRARIARAEAEMEAESQRLEQEIAQLQQQLQEPLSLQLLLPTAGQQVKRGATLDIQWSSTGPVGGDRLRIGLLKRNVLIRTISYGTPNSGSFTWSIPNELPPANDYQISLQDPASGLSALIDNFQIQ